MIQVLKTPKDCFNTIQVLKTSKMNVIYRLRFKQLKTCFKTIQSLTTSNFSSDFENLKKLFPIKTQLESVTMSDSGKRGTAVSTTIPKVVLTVAPKLKSEIVVYLLGIQQLPKSFF
jgi:hypothetical protein